MQQRITHVVDPSFDPRCQLRGHVAVLGGLHSDLSEKAFVGELGSVTRVLEDAKAVDAEALRHGQDDCVVVLLELVAVGAILGVGLVIRVDHVARTTLLGGEDISVRGLAVENPSGFDQVRLKGMNVV